MTIGADSSMSVVRDRRPSLVDVAEEALRTWLATGRHRPGERLPPEQELSAHLGVSRGTLRTALRRLEESGEIVRRQGSGTYVGRATSTTLDEGLEKLVSYSELARRRGVTLELGELTIDERRLGPEDGELFGADPATPAVDGHSRAAARRTAGRVDAGRGQSASGVAAARARARGAREWGDGARRADEARRAGGLHARAHLGASGHEARPSRRALEVSETTAALEIEHVTCTAEERRWSTPSTSSCPAASTST